MKIQVLVMECGFGVSCAGGMILEANGYIYRDYTMDHNDPAQRRVLGEQCRNAFEAGQCVLTYPVAA